MYKSEFAADKTKIKIAALMTWFRTLMPARVVAKTKGLAAAPVFDLFAVKRSYSLRTETNQTQSHM